tara:strand:- start:217758 stop:219092 length:1335 start_codon:yes stop_codon:yes gene_type:complete
MDSGNGNTGQAGLYRFIVPRVLLVAVVLCSSANAVAGKMAYGEVFVRAVDDGPGPVSASSAAPGDELAVPDADSAISTGDYLARLEVIEGQGGPYDNSLAEPLADYARALGERGDPVAALGHYRRALHIVRINEGLYSQRQMPLVQEMLELYRSTGNLQALDDQYDYYFRLYGGGQPPLSAPRLRAALAYLAWQREAVRRDLDSDSRYRMLELYQLNESMITSAADDAAVSDADYVELVLSQLRNLHLLTARFEAPLQVSGFAPATPVLGSEWDAQDFTERRIQDLRRSSLSRGRNLLLDASRRVQSAGNVSVVPSLHLALGDWYQWRGHYARAAEQYREVVLLLQAQGREHDLAQWLGEPVELPQHVQPSGNSAEAEATLQTRYDVSASGRVSNIRIELQDEADSGRGARLARALRQTRFRPRWDSGSAEAVAGVARHYKVLK